MAGLIAKPGGSTVGLQLDPCLGKGLARDANGNPAVNCDECSLDVQSGVLRTISPDYFLVNQFDTWVSTAGAGGSSGSGFFLEDPASLEPGSAGTPFLFDLSQTPTSAAPLIWPDGGTYPTAGGGSRLLTDGTANATKSISWTNNDCQCIRVGLLTESNGSMSTDNGELWQLELGASLDVPNPNDDIASAPVSGFRFARMAIGNRQVTRDDIDGAGGAGPFTLAASSETLRHRYQLLEFTNIREIPPGGTINIFFHLYAEITDGATEPGPFSRLVFLTQRAQLLGWRVPDC